MRTNKLLIFLIIANIVILLAILITWFYFVFSNKDEIEIGGITLTKLPKGTDLTMNQIIEKGKQDISFCDTLKEQYLREPCKKQSIMLRAQEQQNPDICEEYPNQEFIESCKEEIY